MANRPARNREIAQRVGASPTTVIQWRERYGQRGRAGLEDMWESDRDDEETEDEYFARLTELGL